MEVLGLYFALSAPAAVAGLVLRRQPTTTNSSSVTADCIAELGVINT